MTAYLFPRGTTATVDGLRERATVTDDRGCWLWQRAVSTRGYGIIRRDGRSIGAHRFVWTLANGPVPEGMTVDHTCFQPTCINPAHMRLLSASENASLNQRRAKTHCKRGHEFTPENTRVRVRDSGRPTRDCIACGNERSRLRRAAA